MKTKHKRIIKKQRRKSKKLYRGGSHDVSEELAKVHQQNDISEELAKVHQQNEIQLPSISSIPLPGIQILGKAEQFVEGAASNVIDKGANFIGVNLNNPQSLGDKFRAIANQFANPKIGSSLKTMASQVGNIASIGIAAAAPVAEAVSDKLIPVVTKDIKKVGEAGASTVVNLAEDFAGPIIGIPRTALSGLEAGEAAINAASEVVRDVSEGAQVAIHNFKDLAEHPEEAQQIIDSEKNPEEAQQITDSVKTPEEAQQIIDSEKNPEEAQQITDSEKNPEEAVAKKLQQPSNMVDPRLTNDQRFLNNQAAVQAAGAGKRLNCLRKDAIKIGGYIEEAREKFKSSHLTKRKNNVKHRKTTRRNSTYSFSSN